MGSGPRGRPRGRPRGQAVPSGTAPLGLCGATSRGPGALQEPGADGPVAGPAVDSGWVTPSQAPPPPPQTAEFLRHPGQRRGRVSVTPLLTQTPSEFGNELS